MIKTFAAIEANTLQFGNFFDVDQRFGLIKPLLHQNRHVRAAGKNLGIAAMLLEQRASLSNRRRFEIIEVFHRSTSR